METDRAFRAIRMKPADVDEVLAIERDSFAEPWTKNMFLDELANRSARLLVLKMEERIIGYMCFWEILDEAHLMTIAVHPRHRGKGFGKFLMDKLEELSRKAGLKRIILDVARRNRTARNLYGKCGFMSIGFRKSYYKVTGDDALVMEKWLFSEEKEQSATQADAS
jgi:[ribosomal protein S18]-alanine N-acetyltransferase